jgi:hypothetical protein
MQCLSKHRDVNVTDYGAGVTTAPRSSNAAVRGPGVSATVALAAAGPDTPSARLVIAISVASAVFASSAPRRRRAGAVVAVPVSSTSSASSFSRFFLLQLALATDVGRLLAATPAGSGAQFCRGQLCTLKRESSPRTRKPWSGTGVSAPEDASVYVA